MAPGALMEGNRRNGVAFPKVSSWKVRRPRNEIISILSKGVVVKPRKARLVLSDAALKHAVRYILKTNHVKLMEWGLGA